MKRQLHTFIGPNGFTARAEDSFNRHLLGLILEQVGPEAAHYRIGRYSIIETTNGKIVVGKVYEDDGRGDWSEADVSPSNDLYQYQLGFYRDQLKRAAKLLVLCAGHPWETELFDAALAHADAAKNILTGRDRG